MICSTETREAIAAGAGLQKKLSPKATWVNDVYTCDYSLPGGHLVLTVKQLPDDASATTWYDDLRSKVGPGKAITGVRNFGRAAFQADDGIMLVVKDNLTLEVDPRGLPAGIGPDAITRANFAYQVASDVMACWTGTGR